ncbi:hypothetical protein [Mesotoga prima]|uniref:hypothetical protein n=1 Tax=Mesotoga prima TaxID=1184387 RepID=UPI002C852D1D|nr:hypothetical protein [Mesotoga prima]HPA00472.1 hypothetical protein [Mesotoga prima]
MQRVMVESRDGKQCELVIVAQKYRREIAEERKEPNVGLSFFLDEKLVQSLIVVQSEIRLLRVIADNPDAFYTWHVDDLSHQCFVCESTIECVDINYIGKSVEKHGLQRKVLEGCVFRIDRTESDTNFLDLILEELDNATESDSLPIYSLESYRSAGGVR